MLLPKIASAQSPRTDNTQRTDYVFQLSSRQPAQRAESALSAKVPLLPPRLPTRTQSLAAPSAEERAAWFVVLSPRETRGLAGPFSVPQLRQMFRGGELTDGTLVWREGEAEGWRQLVHQPLLRSRLVDLPVIPARRTGQFNAALGVFDPSPVLPDQRTRDGATGFAHLDTTRSCSFCGAIATAHLPTHGESLPDLYKCREEVGTTEFASEILPGFLWVGEAKAARHRTILTLGLTLLVSCAEELPSPPAQEPFFRCREVRLRTKEVLASELSAAAHHTTRAHKSRHHSHSHSHAHNNGEQREEYASEAQAVRDVLRLFEIAYDLIERERLFSDRNTLAQTQTRGSADERFLSADNSRDNAPKRPFRRVNLEDQDGLPAFPPRVLLYSQRGEDRAPAVALAYLVKHYSLSLSHYHAHHRDGTEEQREEYTPRETETETESNDD